MQLSKIACACFNVRVLFTPGSFLVPTGTIPSLHVLRFFNIPPILLCLVVVDVAAAAVVSATIDTRLVPWVVSVAPSNDPWRRPRLVGNKWWYNRTGCQRQCRSRVDRQSRRFRVVATVVVADGRRRGQTGRPCRPEENVPPLDRGIDDSVSWHGVESQWARRNPSPPSRSKTTKTTTGINLDWPLQRPGRRRIRDRPTWYRPSWTRRRHDVVQRRGGRVARIRDKGHESDGHRAS